jgi:hypothetical protein
MKAKLLTLSLLISISVQAQTNLNAGWESFLKNDRTTARNFFTKAALKPGTADESNIALSMLTDMDGTGIEGFSYLNKVANSAKNPQPYLLAAWGDAANHTGSVKNTRAD